MSNIANPHQPLNIAVPYRLFETANTPISQKNNFKEGMGIPSLDNKEETSTSTSSYYSRLRLRSKFQSLFGGSIPSTSMALCGTALVMNTQRVTFSERSGKARYSGSQTCKNLLCPACSLKRQTTEQKKIQKVYTEFLTKDMGQLLFATFTVGFFVGTDFETMFDTLNAHIQKLSTALERKYNIVRSRTIEFTCSYEGAKIHLHVHSLFGFEGMKIKDREAAKDWAFQYWKKIQSSEVVRSVSHKAQKLIWCDTADGVAMYMAKNAAFELAASHNKKSLKENSYNWLDLLQLVVSFPTRKGMDFVVKILTAMKGRKAYSHNKRFFEILEEAPEIEEEEEPSNDFASVNAHAARVFVGFNFRGVTQAELLEVLGGNPEAQRDFRDICIKADLQYNNNFCDNIGSQKVMYRGLMDFVNCYFPSSKLQSIN